MSIKALELLQLVGLLDKNDKVNDLSRFDTKRLQNVLEYYRNDRLRNTDQDATANQSSETDFSALISSVSAVNAAQPLLPSAFVYSHLYTGDPLFKLTNRPDQFREAHNSYLGMEATSVPDVRSVTNAVRYFQQLAPLIRSDVITVLPLDELHAPPESRPLLYSEDWFRSEVPEHLHDFVHRSAIIGEVSPGPDGKGLIMWDRTPQSPTRGISIAFTNDQPVVLDPFYLLFDQESAEHVDDTHIRFVEKLDWDDVPSKELFEAWVYQSVNQAILARLESVAREIRLAQRLGAYYLTESQFESELCGMTVGDVTRAEGRINAVNFLNANTPYLKIDSAETVARLRTDNPQLFERFQQSLLAVASQLNGGDDNFEDRAKQLFEVDIRPQINDLEAALMKVAGGVGGAALLTAGSVGMALLSSTALPFAAVLGLGALGITGGALPSVTEYLSKRGGPAFLWKKLIK